jgi:hypothetical protein
MEHRLDFSRFNFDKIFSAVVATESLKRNQTRPLRSEVQEIAIAKHSDNQLGYCGDSEHGRDFYGKENNLYYESKAMDGLFQKTTGKTASITLKNFRGKCLGMPEKTFDYMLLWDTKTLTAGIASWDACVKNMKIKDAVIDIRIDQSDIEFIVRNHPRPEAEDFGAKLLTLIEECV